MGSITEKYKEIFVDWIGYNLLIRMGDFVYRRYGFKDETISATQSWRLAAANATNIAQHAVKNFDLERRLICTVPKTKADRKAFNRKSKTDRFKYLTMFGVQALSSYVIADGESCSRTKFLCEKVLNDLVGDKLTITEAYALAWSGWYQDQTVDLLFNLALGSKNHANFALADIYRQLSFVDQDFRFIEGANYEL